MYVITQRWSSDKIHQIEVLGSFADKEEAINFFIGYTNTDFTIDFPEALIEKTLDTHNKFSFNDGLYVFAITGSN